MTGLLDLLSRVKKYGVWTGSLIAALMNMRFKLAFSAIVCGNFVAGVIIMLLSHGFAEFIG